VENIV